MPDVEATGGTTLTIKNLVLITIDSLRPDHLGCYGYTRPTSPCIDSLAQEGVRFTQAISNGPSTPASFISILTSTYPLMFGGYQSVGQNRVTVAELLTERGLACAGFHSNPYTSSRYGYGRGFDPFIEFGLRAKGAKQRKRGLTQKARSAWTRFRRERTTYLPYAPASKINQAALTWLRQAKRPFFLWLHYMDVHHPYYPPPRYLEQATGRKISRRQMIALEHMLRNPTEVSATHLQDMIDLYDGCIAYTDSAVGEILNALARLGTWHETAVIVTADHGEEFMEHGGTSHKARLYDELLRVPLVIRVPGIPGGCVINEQVSLLDLGPTLLDLIGSPPAACLMGHSLKPLLDGQPHGGDNLAFSQCYHHGRQIVFSAQEGWALFAVRTPEWKYIWDEEDGQDELYDLRSDPGEQVNLVTQEPEKRLWFRQVLSHHIQCLPGYGAEQTIRTMQPEDDETILERLRGLGYIE